MHNTSILLLTFASFFVASLLGMGLRTVLPEEHLSADTKDSIRIWMGLVATMTALVLGLLISSTKGSFDTERGEIIQLASKIIYLDRLLANYGPEAAPARVLLKRGCGAAIARIWRTPHAEQLPADASLAPEALAQAVQALVAQNDRQRSLKSQAEPIVNELAQMRWLLLEQQESSISTPLLIIVTAWLTIIFASTGLFAPANATVVIALMLAALSVAAAIFLIIELDQPFDGMIQISSEPMHMAFERLGH